MLPHQLGAIDETLLTAGCAERWPESQVLEFKRLLPTADEKGRGELAKDVSALANADGGDLLYGIAEHDACATLPQPITDEPADTAKRRCLQVLESRIEPRVTGLQFHEVPFKAGGYALVLRVPSSFDGPHRYQVDGQWRFVMRVGTLTSEMTYPQLRAAFDRTATLTERARSFRAERVATIRSGSTWRPLHSGALCVLHLIPIASMSGRTSIDINAVYHEGFAQFSTEGWGGASRTLNLDGVIAHPGIGPGQKAVTYVQVFRSGALEAVRFAGRLIGDQKIIPSTMISSYFRESIGKLTTAARGFGASGPAVLGAALLQTSGYGFGVELAYERIKAPADRTDLVVPDFWIERLEDATDVDAIAHPLLDVLWQCFDVERCFEYDKDGRWKGRR